MARDLFVNREPDYTDLDLDFIKHPTTGDVVKKSGVEAIKRAVRNVIFYNFYEKPFQPYFGSNVRGLLFENATPLTSIYLGNAIREVLANFEPRISVTDVVVTDGNTEEGGNTIDRNGYEVRIDYIILNKNLPVSSTLFLERIR